MIRLCNLRFESKAVSASTNCDVASKTSSRNKLPLLVVNVCHRRQALSSNIWTEFTWNQLGHDAFVKYLA